MAMQRPDLRQERRLWAAGCLRVAGLDEAGRGAWAGPVAAAAVILPPSRGLARLLKGVRDSKQMTPLQREMWAERIVALAAAHGVGLVGPEEIDRIGILPATRLAMRRAVEGLSPSPDHLLIDHLRLPDLGLPQTPLTHGDALVLSIAAASVLAKVHRDQVMTALDAQFPGYAFAQHKGYGTQGHQDALARLGPSPIHRRSYAPIQRLAAARPAPADDPAEGSLSDGAHAG
jgi:ribonuclease HII